MKRYSAALFCGLLFGIGLSVSQMAYPAKVIGFLDITGAWDPSLLLVLGGAVGFTVVSFRFVPYLRKPLFDEGFEAPPTTKVDAGLLGGAALFGVGWGLSGFCPGPGVVALGRLSPAAFVFVAAFVAGSAIYRILRRRLDTSRANRNIQVQRTTSESIA